MKTLKTVVYEKNIIFHKLSFVVFGIISYFFFKPILFLFFPGLLIFLYLDLKKTTFFDTFIYSNVFSLSWWICGFWFLKFVPISPHIFFEASLIITFIACILKKRMDFPPPKLTKNDCVAFALIFFMLFFLIPVFKDIEAPPGADMATHSYMARIIVENNTFPKDYEPILPSKNFGSSPIGLPILVSLLTISSGLPINRSALIITVLTYFIFGLGVFVFIKRYFGILVGFFTTFTLLWISNDITGYIGWGGNTTVLSIALLFFNINFGLYIFESKLLSIKHAVALGMLTFAGFTTHFIPYIILVYWILGIVVLFPKQAFNFYVLQKSFIHRLVIIIIVLSVPFLTNIKLPSSENLEFAREWHNRLWPIEESNNFFYLINQMIYYVIKKLSTIPAIFFTIGLFLSLKHKYKYKNLILSCLLVTFLIILNSQFFILPLSHGLYPDRTVTTASIIFSYLIAVFFSFILPNSFKEFLADWPKDRIKVTMVFIGLTIFTMTLYRASTFSYIFLATTIIDTLVVTKDDLNAFRWISENTSQNDTFYNNYEDAGIWIPSVSFRKVLVTDSNLLDIEDANKVKKTSYNYLYVGSKLLPPALINQAQKRALSNSKYQLVYFSGESKIYKIVE